MWNSSHTFLHSFVQQPQRDGLNLCAGWQGDPEEEEGSAPDGPQKDSTRIQGSIMKGGGGSKNSTYQVDDDRARGNTRRREGESTSTSTVARWVQSLSEVSADPGDQPELRIP